MDLLTNHYLTAGLHLALAACFAAGVGVVSAYDVFKNWTSHRDVALFSLPLGLFGFAAAVFQYRHSMWTLDQEFSTLIDFWTVAFALPPAATWLFLRWERFAKGVGSGDRMIRGYPEWLRRIPSIFLVLMGFFLGWAWRGSWRPWGSDARFVEWGPHLIAAAALFVVGWVFWQEQQYEFAKTRTWSLSGLALGAMFPGLAVYHGYIAGVLRKSHDLEWTSITLMTIIAAVSVWLALTTIGIYRDNATKRKRRRRRRQERREQRRSLPL